MVLMSTCRLNIPVIRRRVLKRLRGPIVKVPVVERYCDPNNRKPPLPKSQRLVIKVSEHTDLGTEESVEEV
jgi:hypothetical protein